jgi:hypothetical protein
MKHMTVQQSLKFVADNPKQLTDEVLQLPAYELIARNLFEICNNPDANVRGSMAKANRARKMIMDRMAGTRKTGTHPATKEHIPIEFIDLTGDVEEVPDDEPASEADARASDTERPADAPEPEVQD